MLTITFRKLDVAVPVDEPSERFYSWKVKTAISVEHEEEMFPSDEGWTPVVVEASGSELEWMGRNFSGLPRANAATNPIQKWRGEFAQFIYDHLPRTE